MHVRIRCRQPPVVSRLQPRAASFVSLQGLVDNDVNNVSSLGEIGAGQIGSRRNGRNTSSNPLVRSVPQQNRPPSDRVDKNLLRLFVSEQPDDPSPLRNRYSPQDKSTSQDSTDDDLEVLNRMLHEEKGPLKVFLQQCKETIGIEARKSSAESHETLADHTSLAGRDVFAGILIRICRSRSRDPLRHHFAPTVSEIVRLYLKHNVMNQRWYDLLGIQIGSLLESVHDPISAEVTREISDNAAPIFEELLDTWAIYLQEHGKPQYTIGVGTNSFTTLDKTKDSMSKSGLSQPKSSTLHGSSMIKEINSADISGYSKSPVLKLLHPRVNFVTAAAIVTHKYFQLLIQKHLPVSTSTESAQSFLQFSEQSTKEIKLDHHIFQGLSTHLVEYGTPFNIVNKALAGCGVPRSKEWREYPVSSKVLVTPGDKTIINDNMTWECHQVISLVEKLNRAINQADEGLAISVWNSFQTKPMRQDVTELLRDNVFIRFIQVFFLLRRPKLSVAVWNLMIKSDLVPKQKHWNAMMVGSSRIKDLASMKACWSQMKAAGIEPDILSWTTWVHGLIKCGEWRLGIGALEELARLWKKTPKVADSNNGETHRLLPSIEPVNAAISALLAMKMPHIVPRIFDWAKLQEIPLSISTFNIMLEFAVRNDETRRIDQLLSEMKLHNCQPDIVTFNTILKGLLRQPNSSFHTQTPEGQQAIILTLLTNLQQRGLCVTGGTYSTILSSLLAPETANITAARAVLNHMAQNKFQPSFQVYTTLMKHYFSVTPLDFSDIDSLWRRIRRDQKKVDSAFFEAMIKWYAGVGEVERMLQFARHMSDDGKSPSWTTLLRMLETLVRTRDWDLTNELVVDVSDHKHGLLRHGEGVEKKGKKLFWDLVATLREQGWLGSKEK